MRYQLILRPNTINHSTVTRHSQRDCKQEAKNNEKVQNNLQRTGEKGKLTENQLILSQLCLTFQ